jgi:hypothetical protein
MSTQPDPDKLCDTVQAMKNLAEDLKRTGASVPAVTRNTVRILASIKMLEINLCDVVETNTSPGVPPAKSRHHK